MKKNIVMLFILSVILLGCVSSAENARYREMTEGKEIDDYFKATSGILTFSSLEEAYDYIFCAKLVLKRKTFWNREKGLAAILTGSEIDSESPVTVFYMVEAFSNESWLNIPEGLVGTALEKEALGAITVFMVFYGDKAVSVTDYYIEEGYMWPHNDMPEVFKFSEYTFLADYPRGWGMEKAFEYLRGEEVE